MDNTCPQKKAQLAVTAAATTGVTEIAVREPGKVLGEVSSNETEKEDYSASFTRVYSGVLDLTVCLVDLSRLRMMHAPQAVVDVEASHGVTDTHSSSTDGLLHRPISVEIIHEADDPALTIH
ncbi:hypothetical protein N7466_006767 [Penicillium verhagenii]|uniref:uncharacterized protein n=1 Tax=Penicillium verhagenii TaxID=1562060 RepID=UPI002545660B|nr:uncharacterized protein N7466_006767 [Penicillium verhagenii]KAJ5927811.1 hypothetical protein N7466_006767 [Penicillium verhagenii]